MATFSPKEQRGCVCVYVCVCIHTYTLYIYVIPEKQPCRKFRKQVGAGRDSLGWLQPFLGSLAPLLPAEGKPRATHHVVEEQAGRTSPSPPSRTRTELSKASLLMSLDIRIVESPHLG